jgi:hypothetical protein
MNMSNQGATLSGMSRISGKSARFASALFNYGNVAAILVPVPLGLLWVGASMVIYAMNRHHPNPKVGHYTQQAAYRFYGVTGFFVAIATFFPRNAWAYYLTAWVLAAAILVPWSIIELIRIRRDSWDDMEIPTQEGQ